MGIFSKAVTVIALAIALVGSALADFPITRVAISKVKVKQLDQRLSSIEGTIRIDTRASTPIGWKAAIVEKITDDGAVIEVGGTLPHSYSISKPFALRVPTTALTERITIQATGIALRTGFEMGARHTIIPPAPASEFPDRYIEYGTPVLIPDLPYQQNTLRVRLDGHRPNGSALYAVLQGNGGIWRLQKELRLSTSLRYHTAIFDLATIPAAEFFTISVLGVSGVKPLRWTTIGEYKEPEASAASIASAPPSNDAGLDGWEDEGGSIDTTPSTTLACSATPSVIKMYELNEGESLSSSVKCEARFSAPYPATTGETIRVSSNPFTATAGAQTYDPATGIVSRTFAISDLNNGAGSGGGNQLGFVFGSGYSTSTATVGITIVHGEIEYVPQQIDVADGMGRLIVSLSPNPTAGSVVVNVGVPEDAPFEVTSDTPLTFTATDKFRVVEFKPIGATQYGKLGTITLSIADGSKQGFYAVDKAVDVVRKRPLCVPAGNSEGECLYSDHTMVSERITNAVGDTYHRIDFTAFKIAIGGGLKTTVEYECLEKACFNTSNDLDADGTGAKGSRPLFFCGVTGGMAWINEPSLTTRTMILKGTDDREVGSCSGWSRQPYRIRAITTRAAK